jgi:hypothetical protein
LRRGAARRAGAVFFGAFGAATRAAFFGVAARAGVFRAAPRRFDGFGGRARRVGFRRATARFRPFFAGFAAGRLRTGLARRTDRPRGDADFRLGDRRDRARFLAAITALPRSLVDLGSLNTG